KNDKLHGEYKEYTERGELIAEGQFNEGWIVGRNVRQYGDYGMTVEINVDSSGNGSFTAGYFGSPSFTGKFKNHYRHGDWIKHARKKKDNEITVFNADSTYLVEQKRGGARIKEMAAYVFIVEYGLGDEVADGEIVDFPEVLARYPGGNDSLTKFIKQNLIYPDSMAEIDISGRFYLSFIIEIDGSLSNIKVERGIHPDLDEQAVQLLDSIPPWEAAEQSGKIVRSRGRIRIPFQLQNSLEDRSKKHKKE
ncbi:energy transducer TonB, partial [Crocinitomicaceae bacterium]|nr:energy transducer TonB [Crocinitomicaceae bacterium]